MLTTSNSLTSIIRINGQLLLMLAAVMLIPAAVDFFADDQEWQVFLLSAAITGFFGGLILLSTSGVPLQLDLRSGYLLTASSWFVVSLFATLPMVFSALDYSFVDYYFETMSGLTTTGSTVFVGLDDMDLGMLLWRSLLQWFGGIGIVVLVMSLFPRMSIGGMQLFQSESSEISDKLVPRTSTFVSCLFVCYGILTVACAFLYWLVGMSGFDAVNHAMTTVSTAGFSTKDASLGHFDSVPIELVSILFMIAGALPLILYAQMLYNFKFRNFWRASQVPAFFALLAIFLLIITVWLWQAGIYDGFWQSLRYALFNVTSIITTTGYATANFSDWGSFAQFMFLMLFFIGGCAGSTSGGVKIFRWQIMWRGTIAQMKSTLHPHRVIIEKYNGKSISQTMINAVRSFFFIYLFAIMVIGTVLMSFGLDFLTGLSAAVQVVGNIGPGLGDVIGPAGNYIDFPDAGKFVMTLGMLLGRLEIFTILLLFVPEFWKR